MKKTKFTWKVWLWIIVFLFSLVSLFYTPYFLKKGVLVTSVIANSSAFEQGLRQNQVITSIDGMQITNTKDFENVIKLKSTLTEKTKTTIKTLNGEYVIYSENPFQFSVSNLPKTNLQMGLDLAGGARALIQAKNHSLTQSEASDLVSMMDNRFNTYGLTDMTIKSISDLSGNYFVLIEIAGATPNDLKNLVSQQGKFEAKIENQTVFIGGEKDIASVSRGGQEAGIYSCNPSTQGGYVCEFRFAVYLSPEAAERQANITKNIEVNTSINGGYLSKKLDLYVDDSLMDSLLISEDLKGKVTTQIQISGSGTGETQADAYKNAEEQMKKLQTILITGSLPFQLEIAKLDTISPTLGSDFARYLLIAGVISISIVALIVFLRYRSKKAILPLIICTSEIIITLGIAAFIKWNLDLASIAGILTAIGTGVDDQIVILDEAIGGNKEKSTGIKQRIKQAFTIILGAYFTTVASLLPLWKAGGGLLKGFVFTTLIGVTLGVLITRPAFADLVKMNED
ncbi:MMPL family transporter [Candidatus Woesearchaeota archaeon]|nr:MMPL family transporter [Candidatus Woesearchaeota archaeon]